MTDVLLVITYWLTAVSAEGTGSELGQTMSSKPETLLVLFAFTLYVLWDWFALQIRKNWAFPRRKIEQDQPPRRCVTRWAWLASAVVALGAWLADPRSEIVIVTVDVLLIALLVGFRYAKDRVGDPMPPKPRGDRAALLGQLEDTVRKLRDA